MSRCRSTMAVIFAASLAASYAHAADPALVEAAKKEGEVFWYTTQIISQLVRPVTAAFEKKYGIKVLSTRADSTEVAVRVISETQAGRTQSDVIDGISTVVPLKRAGYVLKWTPDAAKSYPAQYKDADGYWVANNLFFLTAGFNTSLVPRGTEPRTYEALLDPKWRGKMAWSTSPTSSGGPGFIGTVLTEMGEAKGMAYLRELSKQKIANIGSCGPRRARSDDRRRISRGAADLQPSHRHQRQERRAGRLDQDGARHRLAVGDLGAQECPAPQCRQAARRLHHLARGPADFPRCRLSAGRSGVCRQRPRR